MTKETNLQTLTEDWEKEILDVSTDEVMSSSHPCAQLEPMSRTGALELIKYIRSLLSQAEERVKEKFKSTVTMASESIEEWKQEGAREAIEGVVKLIYAKKPIIYSQEPNRHIENVAVTNVLNDLLASLPSGDNKETK